MAIAVREMIKKAISNAIDRLALFAITDIEYRIPEHYKDFSSDRNMDMRSMVVTNTTFQEVLMVTITPLSQMQHLQGSNNQSIDPTTFIDRMRLAHGQMGPMLDLFMGVITAVDQLLNKGFKLQSYITQRCASATWFDFNLVNDKFRVSLNFTSPNNNHGISALDRLNTNPLVPDYYFTINRSNPSQYQIYHMVQGYRRQALGVNRNHNGKNHLDRISDEALRLGIEEFYYESALSDENFLMRGVLDMYRSQGYIPVGCVNHVNSNDHQNVRITLCRETNEIEIEASL